MPPEENDETQQTLEAVNAQLEGEEKAGALLAEKDARIAELQAEGEALRAERSNLQASLSEAKQAAESLRAEGVAISEAHARAIAKYLDAVRLANPAIPRDIIDGETIEDIDASVEKARTIADAVRQNLEAQAKEARVPAGAPTRGTISLEGLSPREKIAAGIQQKGGTS
jgi:septal ring factor EnvC (AmiA/AmiB activator)